MEACGAAHHWARMLTGLGHSVKLIAPEAVRPFVKRGKKNDAEFGLTVPPNTDKLDELKALVEANDAVPKGARQAVRVLLDYRQALAESATGFEAVIVAHARQDDTARRLGRTRLGRITKTGNREIRRLLVLADLDGASSGGM